MPSHPKNPRRHELEPSGKSVAFFLTLPVVFLVLLFLSLACEDPERATSPEGAEAERTTAVAPDRDPASSPARAVSAPERPEPPLEGDGEVETPTASEPVTYGNAEKAYLEGRYDEAVTLFEAYAERRPENPWGHYMLGLSAWKAGQPVEAERALRETVERSPEHRKAWVNLSRVLLDDGRVAEARQAVASALALEPERSDALRVLGLVEEADGDAGEAADAFRRALTVDPRDAWSMNNLSLIRIRRGEFASALPPLARAVELRDDVAVFHNNLAVALERTGRFAAAAEHYRKADELPGGHENAAVSLARVEGLSEPAGVEPVELASLAGEFADIMEEWKEERMAGTDGAHPDDDTSGDERSEGSSSPEERTEEGPPEEDPAPDSSEVRTSDLPPTT